ncbi:hypothetical protein RISK_006311 [Rhodopirellula islandica]|uniref:Uncharacterized protein n=1 Tax=Rhodopirellula islandica TaxID=595434 RepID=A0A0J1B419_RHOIS|nr:hypothetical protein RISK_006311 [Rhodopirellula islandica]
MLSNVNGYWGTHWGDACYDRLAQRMRAELVSVTLANSN